MTTKQACRFPDRKTVRTPPPAQPTKERDRTFFRYKTIKNRRTRIRYFHPLPFPDGNNEFSDNRI